MLKKLLLFLGVAIVSVILSACTDSEIKKMNGEWHTVDETENVKLVIKNGKVKIINYGGFDKKEHAEKFAVHAKLYKDDEQVKFKKEDANSKNVFINEDYMAIDDTLFERIK